MRTGLVPDGGDGRRRRWHCNAGNSNSRALVVERRILARDARNATGEDHVEGHANRCVLPLAVGVIGVNLPYNLLLLRHREARALAWGPLLHAASKFRFEVGTYGASLCSEEQKRLELF